MDFKKIVFIILYPILFLPAAFATTVVSTDTTWSGHVVLTDTVQVLQGATLTIAPGTSVYGTPPTVVHNHGSFPALRLEIYGAAVIDGTNELITIYNVGLIAKGDTEDTSVVIENALLIKSEVSYDGLPNTGDLAIQNSTLINSPIQTGSVASTNISRNVIINGSTNNSALSIGTSGTSAVINGNLFFSYWHAVAVKQLSENPASPVVFTDNNFYLAEADATATRAVSFPFATGLVAVGTGNYIDYTHMAAGDNIGLDDVIYDINDNPRGAIVELDDMTDKPNDGGLWLTDIMLPQDLWSNIAATFPSLDVVNGSSERDNFIAYPFIQVNGYADLDTLHYSVGSTSPQNLIEKYHWWKAEDAWYVYSFGPGFAHGFSIDKLVDIERIGFGEKVVAFDINGYAGRVAKILGVVFGKEYARNAEYAGIGIHYLDGGMSYEDLGEAAILERLGINPGSIAVLNLLYTNVMNVPPTPEDQAYFSSLLDSGELTLGQLTVMAAETPQNAENIGLDEMATAGLEYINHEPDI